jgi:hypothetical protein
MPSSKHILTAIFGFLFLTMVLLIADDLLSKVLMLLVGITATFAVYLILSKDKNKKYFSEINILKFRIIRCVFGSLAIAFGISLIGLIVSLIFLGPGKADKFIFSPLWFLIYFALAAISFPFVVRKMD